MNGIEKIRSLMKTLQSIDGLEGAVVTIKLLWLADRINDLLVDVGNIRVTVIPKNDLPIFDVLSPSPDELLEKLEAYVDSLSNHIINGSAMEAVIGKFENGNFISTVDKHS